ncbi:growth-regulating factor 7-like [Vicia villosa]|uniref:growth-regulating factor 7-like n=1 Tax=Vicia villosa TaxID=3911 RepID=UPI00273CA9BB|nr:growth-regulating factor 7-like [Vicia villosa]
MRSFNKNKGLAKNSNTSPRSTILKSAGGGKTASLGNPFTKVQLRELERQITIYKYFTACVSVPSYLLSSTPTSSCSTSSSYNINDPVEGRCRRTDGKQWRCSRGVGPNNQYCDRHMHRGTRRSKKSAELRNNHTRNYSSHFAASTSSPPYLQPSVSSDNRNSGVQLASSFEPSNKQPRMLNGDPMSLGASNSGWHYSIPVNHQCMKSLPQYNTLLYNPTLVPIQPRGISSADTVDKNASATGESSVLSIDYSNMGPLGEIFKPYSSVKSLM